PPFTFAPNNLGITEPVETITIDGTTQPGFTGTPIIEIDGSNVPQGAFSNGISFSRTFGSPVLLSSNSVLRGIVLNRNKSAGVRINQQDLSSIRIENCYIGTDITGTVARPNAQGGIVLGGNTHGIGGTVPAAGNVIAG